jgi:hypothetical protein
MDWQILINIGLRRFYCVWWVGSAREIWDSLKELRKDLHHIEKNLPEVYVRRDELREVRQELTGSL